VLSEIRKAGFKPEAIHIDNEISGETHHPAQNFWTTWGKLFTALVLALCAEALAFMLPESLAVKVVGMTLAVLAIGLSGFSVYGKGLSALRQGRLNINALMTVAITGAFLIG